MELVPYHSTETALFRVPRNLICHILWTLNSLFLAALNIIVSSLLEILVVPKVQPKTKTYVQMVYLGERFQDAKVRDHRAEEKASTNQAVLWSRP